MRIFLKKDGSLEILSGIYNTKVRGKKMAIIKGLHAQLIKEQLENALKKKGHAFFDGNKKYNLNIIGIRNKDPVSCESQLIQTVLQFLCQVSTGASIGLVCMAGRIDIQL